MKIATFGCSWTQGVSTVDDSYCWPKALAEDNQYHVDNFALAGSSLSFQVYLLNDVIKHNTYDKVIFQITSPQRLTYFDDSLDYGQYLKTNQNYRELDRTGDIYRNFICITPGHLQLSSSDSFWDYPDKHNFAKLYYKYTNKHISRLEYIALVEYLKNKVDFLFFHNEDVCKIGNVPIVIDRFGTDYVADKGQHFNKQGSQLVADWIMENV